MFLQTNQLLSPSFLSTFIKSSKCCVAAVPLYRHRKSTTLHTFKTFFSQSKNIFQSRKVKFPSYDKHYCISPQMHGHVNSRVKEFRNCFSRGSVCVCHFPGSRMCHVNLYFAYPAQHAVSRGSIKEHTVAAEARSIRFIFSSLPLSDSLSFSLFSNRHNCCQDAFSHCPIPYQSQGLRH